jgi:hypothetical protein
MNNLIKFANEMMNTYFIEVLFFSMKFIANNDVTNNLKSFFICMLYRYLE